MMTAEFTNKAGLLSYIHDAQAEIDRLDQQIAEIESSGRTLHNVKQYRYWKRLINTRHILRGQIGDCYRALREGEGAL